MWVFCYRRTAGVRGVRAGGMTSRRTTPRGHVLLEHGRPRRRRVKPCHPARGQRLDTCAAAVRLVNRDSDSRRDLNDEPYVQLGKRGSESRVRQTRFHAGEPRVGGAVPEAGATMRNGDISVAETRCDQRSRVAFRKRGTRTGGNDSAVGRGGPLCRGGWRPGLLRTSPPGSRDGPAPSASSEGYYVYGRTGVRPRTADGGMEECGRARPSSGWRA